MKTRVKQLLSHMYVVQVKEGFFYKWKTLADKSGKIKKYITKHQAEVVASAYKLRPDTKYRLV